MSSNPVVLITGGGRGIGAATVNTNRLKYLTILAC